MNKQTNKQQTQNNLCVLKYSLPATYVLFPSVFHRQMGKGVINIRKSLYPIEEQMKNSLKALKDHIYVYWNCEACIYMI